jgi:hypothetical protein
MYFPPKVPDNSKLSAWSCSADGSMNDKDVGGSSVKYCNYQCSAKNESTGKWVDTKVSAPGYETGRGQVCEGANVATTSSMNGDVYNYALSYDSFSVRTRGFLGWWDSLYRSGELVNGLRRAEQGEGRGK